MASYRKRGKAWEIRTIYTDIHGEIHSKSKGGFKTKKEAELYVNELSKNAKQESTIESTIFKDYFDDWAATYRLPNITKLTAQLYSTTSKHIDNFFGNTDIKNITRRNYQSFINNYGENRSKSSVSKVNTLIRACVQNAVYEDVIPKDFTKDIILTFDKSKTRDIDYLNLDEIKRLTQYLIATKNRHFTSKYMILTALYTGARLGEIMALTWNDINFNFKTITINKAWDYTNGGGFKSTKNESSKRVIRVNTELLNILKDLINNDSNMIFLNQYKTIPSSSAVNKTLKDSLTTLSIERHGFHFHSLRHSHVAFLLANNVDIYAISKRLGHSNLGTTTKVYAYLIDEYKAKADLMIDSSLDTLTRTNTLKEVKK